MGLLPTQDNDAAIWQRIYEDDAQFERCQQEMDALLFQTQHSIERLESFTEMFQRCAGIGGTECRQPSMLQVSSLPAYSSNDHQCSDASLSSGTQRAVQDSSLDGKILDALKCLRDLVQEQPNNFMTPQAEAQEQQMLSEQNFPHQTRRLDMNVPNSYVPGRLAEAELPEDHRANMRQVERKLEQLLGQQAASQPQGQLPMSLPAPRPQAIPLTQDAQFEQTADGWPSVGSIGHFAKACKPCVFLYNGMCLKGTHCQFCHINHDSDAYKRVRPSKRTRNLLRQHRNQESEGTLSDQIWQ